MPGAFLAIVFVVFFVTEPSEAWTGDEERARDARHRRRVWGNVGTDPDYQLPGRTQPGPGWTVLVGCRAFAVPIANRPSRAA